MNEYEWSMPIDVGILKSLPDEGSRLGYHVLGSTVKVVKDKLNAELPDDAPAEARVTSEIIAQRITRWLRPKGMVVEVKVHGAGGSKGYQRTEAGARMLRTLEKEEER